MTGPIMNDLAIFTAELNKAFDQLLAKHLKDEESELQYYVPMTLALADSDGGIFAMFYEEGVEFYPKMKIVTVAEDA